MDNEPRTIIAARTADLREMLAHNADEFEGITKDDALAELLDAMDKDGTPSYETEFDRANVNKSSAGVTHLPDDGELRMFAPNTDEGDHGFMFVLDVFGVCVLVRERDSDVYVHIDTVDIETERPGNKPVTYEINNTGGNEIG